MNEDKQYVPVGDILLIKVDKPATETASGILIKEDWKTLPPTGVVLEEGELVKGHYRGKTVVFERYSSVMLSDDLRLCRESNILARKK